MNQHITSADEAKDLPRQMDITAPEGDVEIQIRADGTVIWIHIEDVTVLRVCRISGEIKIDDGRERRPGSTPWQVLCPTHGPVSLIRKEYERQLMAADSLWACPICGQPAPWDDDNYEAHKG